MLHWTMEKSNKSGDVGFIIRDKEGFRVGVIYHKENADKLNLVKKLVDNYEKMMNLIKAQILKVTMEEFGNNEDLGLILRKL